ncbi:MAG: flagellar protein FlgN [Pseudomonadota bacterium]
MASPATTLRDEQALMSTLLKLMKQEQQLLVSADTEGLTAITPQKSQLIVQMGQLASQRHQTLGSLGCAAQDAGMETWLDHANDPASLALWQDLLSLTREAKELNRVNGMLINKQLQHNQTIINAMRTPANAAETGFYGPSGQAVSGGASRRFVVG